MVVSFVRWRKPEYPEKSTDLSQVTDVVNVYVLSTINVFNLKSSPEGQTNIFDSESSPEGQTSVSSLHYKYLLHEYFFKLDSSLELYMF